LETPSPAIELEKLAAAREAALLIEPGMVVGLGSGSTVNRLIEVLAETRPDAVFVAASPASERAAAANGLRLLSLDAAGRLDLAIDGADQINSTGWLIKGGGAAQMREKILAAAAQRFVVIASRTSPSTGCAHLCRSSWSPSPSRRPSPRSAMPSSARTPRAVRMEA
jgi:ribose 5-phosphate isomerase A